MEVSLLVLLEHQGRGKDLAEEESDFDGPLGLREDQREEGEGPHGGELVVSIFYRFFSSSTTSPGLYRH